MYHTVSLETYHVIGIPLVTSGLLTFNGAVISQTANAARNTLSLKRRNGAKQYVSVRTEVRVAVCLYSDCSPNNHSGTKR